MIFGSIAIVLVLLLGIGLYNASKLQSIHIQKSVIINGSPSEVFDMVRYLNNFPQWSPFLAQDPAQQYEVKGTDGEVGAQYHWFGNKGKDIGFQEIVKVVPDSFIGMRCDIQKPFVAQPTFEYTFEETKAGIRVTQDFKLQSGLIDAFFMGIFGAKKAMDQTNEKGMMLLKKAVEG